MIGIVALLAASQVPLAPDPGELRWRRFVHHAVAADTPFSTRMDELRRSVKTLPPRRAGRAARGIGGPSGL